MTTGTERVSLFSDGVFAVIITILVLELHPPEEPTFAALAPLWPTGLSYAVSYVFIAIVWVNHHHLFGYAGQATPRLLWSNFAHLFSVSLIPFTTEWVADSRLAAAPVAFYSSVFVLVNATYLAICWEVVDRPASERATLRVRRMMRMRSFITLAVFVLAAALALQWPAVGMALICLCLLGYLRPDAPGARRGSPRDVRQPAPPRPAPR
ncbi:TMEM175 family protein [Mycolicibacterium baixiangningiae]|uniref:TMEM175 family protein n=1 Tax=Mycolicibacterium baixiangningiae TaxID=2761578 RepID=UPI0018681B7C|nr:TMEM175 family protein [Mycolicibacterium baixiangningiae]